MVAGSLEEILVQFGGFLCDFPPPKNIAIKINLSSPPSVNSPQSDAGFLKRIIDFLLVKGYSVTLVEGAGGYLRENLEAVGLQSYLQKSSVHWIDLDTEKEVFIVERGKRAYPIPKVLTQADLRVAIPCATKRKGYLFSCNVKTFVGLLPRELCQNGTNSVFSRPMIHEDLTETVSDLYLVIQEVIPFHFYLNGGNTVTEMLDIDILPQYYCSSDPVELDEYLADVLQVEHPGYLKRLKKNLQKTKGI